MSYLNRIQSPADIRSLNEAQLSELCEEIRHVLIEQVTRNGGHLASNLGVVEITVAIHRVFDSPKDHIIFDVGHQSYVHKLLTGRAPDFSSLRTPGGISGFPKREESDHDAFGTGHASTSLSAGLGFAEADRSQGNGSYTVVVMGDGAFTGGMIHEALNNCHKDLRLILIINENEMSISKNIGQFAKQLARLRARPAYLKTKSFVGNALASVPLIGQPTKNAISHLKKAIKDTLYGSNYFEDMGLKYLGPADGNDRSSVEILLRRAKESGRACVIHLKTTKGKGYAPAVEEPAHYHALSPLSKKQAGTSQTFSQAFGDVLMELAEKDDKLCAITAAMKHGTGLLAFGERYPKQLFDVGIAEEHAVTFAAGLAANNYHPVVAIYSTFLQRAYDSILHDIALQSLPVLFCVDRAGLNAADGPTHHGIFDVSFFIQAGMEIWEPISTDDLRTILRKKVSGTWNTSCAIRYPSGYPSFAVNAHFSPENRRVIADGIICDYDPKTPPRTIILTAGRICEQAIRVKEQMNGECGIILLQKIYPFDDIIAYLQYICTHSTKPDRLFLLEEGVYQGGWAMSLDVALRESLPTFDAFPRTKILAIRTPFVSPQKGQTIWQAMRLDESNIFEEIKK